MTLAAALACLLSSGLLLAKPGTGAPAAMQCKPCGSAPLDAALDQAHAVVLAKVVATLEPLPTKGTPGEGFVQVQATQWLFKSTDLPHPIPPSKGLKTLRVRFYWDGCRASPPDLKKGDSLILFLSQGEAYNGPQPAWEATPNPCTLAMLRPGDPGYDLKALKKTLKQRMNPSR
jgi:hypothetical protein